MADIKNKNELKRRIELFMDELDYSINEEFCKETMIMMREFIGRASHLLDCTDAKIKKAKRTARNKAIDEFAEKLNNSIDMLDLNYEYRCDGGVQHQTLNNMREIIQELSEQLKVGGNNE